MTNLSTSSHSVPDLCICNCHLKFSAFRFICLLAMYMKLASIYEPSSQLSNQQLGVRGGCICPRSASSGKEFKYCNTRTEMIINEVTIFQRTHNTEWKHKQVGHVANTKTSIILVLLEAHFLIVSQKIRPRPNKFCLSPNQA